ncbi:hypothetical protein N0V82_001603 [Gnomoniopsis sp. IMI 355080]|nr:hypothetical protein N0V82_001603 [Gnomoniopsis sp. IMI 355080]
MLRGRRLLLPQSPLSEWRTTTSSATTTTTAIAAARWASHSTPQDPDVLGSGSSVPAAETETRSNDDEAVKGAKEQDVQNSPNANSETDSKDSPAFRKFGQDHLLFRKHGMVNRASLRTHLDAPQSSFLKLGAADQWTEEWVKKVGNRLGLRISKNDEVDFKISIARRMAVDVDDPKLASPASALAEITQQERVERVAKRAATAKNRQGNLTLEGAQPLFRPRNDNPQRESSFQSRIARNEAKVTAPSFAVRTEGLKAKQSSQPLSLPRENEFQKEPNFQSRESRAHIKGIAPKFHVRTQGSEAAQSSSGQLLGGDLPDGLSYEEFLSAQADAGRSALDGEAQDQTESFFQRRGFPVGLFESASLSYKGERAPTGIRFTMRPTWLPFNHPGAQATEEKKPIASSHRPVGTSDEDTAEDSSHRAQGATEDLPTPKSGSEAPLPPQPSTDITDPTKHLTPFDFAPLPVPRNRPVSPKQIDQAPLVNPPQLKQSGQNIYGMLFPEETEPEPKSSRAQGNAGRKGKPVAKRRLRVEKTSGDIYNMLFPDDVPQQTESQLHSPPQPEEVAQRSPSRDEEALVPPEDSIFVSLRNEVRNWIPEAQRKNITAPEPGEPGSHSTVMILSGLSNSLVDTDFYRILPESKHIEGWAGGLVKVVQARDALSHEPVGRYFLMFHSKPAADAYKAEVLRLHALSKRLLHSFVGKGPLASAPVDPQLFLTDAEKAAVRSFTLCPPTAPLNINVHMWNTNLIREIAQDTNIADVVQALRPDVATPSKVLVTVNTIPGSKAGAGGGLTTDELWLTLRDDGRERGAPWVLSNLKEGIRPIKMMSSAVHGKIDFRSEAVQVPLEGPIYDELDMLAEPPPASTTSTSTTTSETNAEPLSARKVTYEAWYNQNLKKDEMGHKTMLLTPESVEPVAAKRAEPEERFNRFVVTFTQPAVSRRFVRSWHKRAIWDAHERRTVSIDAVALM